MCALAHASARPRMHRVLQLARAGVMRKHFAADVAIMAKGRLVTTGRLTGMLAFPDRGWEVVAAGVDADLRAALGQRHDGASGGRGTLRGSNLVPILHRRPVAARRLAAVGQSDPRHARDFFVKRVTAPDVQGSRSWPSVQTREGCALMRPHRSHRAERLPRIRARQGALQPGLLCRGIADGGVVSSDN